MYLGKEMHDSFQVSFVARGLQNTEGLKSLIYWHSN
jgi:hypothetical protein